MEENLLDLKSLKLSRKQLCKFEKIRKKYSVSVNFLIYNSQSISKFISYALSPRPVIKCVLQRRKRPRTRIVLNYYYLRRVLFDKKRLKAIKERKMNVQRWSKQMVGYLRRTRGVRQHVNIGDDSGDEDDPETPNMPPEEVSKQLKEQLELLKTGKRTVELMDGAEQRRSSKSQPEEKTTQESAEDDCNTALSEPATLADSALLNSSILTSPPSECQDEQEVSGRDKSADQVENTKNFLDILMSKCKGSGAGSKMNDQSTAHTNNNNKDDGAEPTLRDREQLTDSSDEFLGFDEVEQSPGMMMTPLVRQRTECNSAFVSESLNEYMRNNSLESSSNAAADGGDKNARAARRHRQASLDGLVTPGCVAPHMEMPAVPESLQRLRTVGERRQYLQKFAKNHKLAIINNEATICRELQRKLREPHKRKSVSQQIVQATAAQLPFTRSGWRAAAFVTTEFNKYYFQTLDVDNGSDYVRLPGTSGNNDEREKRPYVSKVRSAASHCSEDCVDAAVWRDFKVIPTQTTMRKLNKAPAALPTGFRPCPLSHKPFQTPLDDETAALLLAGGSMAVVQMPIVELQVYPELGRSLDEVAKRYLQYILPHCDITREWAEFSVSTLKQPHTMRDAEQAAGTDAAGERRKSFTFVIPYMHDRNQVLVRRVVDRSEKLDESFTQVDDGANRRTVDDFKFRALLDRNDSTLMECADMLGDMINTVAISCAENSFHKDDPDNIYAVQQAGSSALPPKQNARAEAKPEVKALPTPALLAQNKKQSRLLSELRRLNATIIDAAAITEKDGKPCVKDHCRLGCVCGSLSCDNPLRQHCGKPRCMIECTCKGSNQSRIMRLETDGRSITTEDAFMLRRKATARLARMEKEFTSTVVLTENETLLINESQYDKKRRCTKAPKRYDDFADTDDDFTRTSPMKSGSGGGGSGSSTSGSPSAGQLTTIETPDGAGHAGKAPTPLREPINLQDTVLDQLKHCKVSLMPLRDTANIAVWCMVHELYKCFCGGRSLDGKPLVIEKEEVNETRVEGVSVGKAAVGAGTSSSRARYSFERHETKERKEERPKEKEKQDDDDDDQISLTCEETEEADASFELVTANGDEESESSGEEYVDEEACHSGAAAAAAFRRREQQAKLKRGRPSEGYYIHKHLTSKPDGCRRVVAMPQKTYLRLNRKRAPQVHEFIRKNETSTSVLILKEHVMRSVFFHKTEMERHIRHMALKAEAEAAEKEAAEEEQNAEEEYAEEEDAAELEDAEAEDADAEDAEAEAAQSRKRQKAIEDMAERKIREKRRSEERKKLLRERIAIEQETKLSELELERERLRDEERDRVRRAKECERMRTAKRKRDIATVLSDWDDDDEEVQNKRDRPKPAPLPVAKHSRNSDPPAVSTVAALTQSKVDDEKEKKKEEEEKKEQKKEQKNEEKKKEKKKDKESGNTKPTTSPLSAIKRSRKIESNGEDNNGKSVAKRRLLSMESAAEQMVHSVAGKSPPKSTKSAKEAGAAQPATSSTAVAAASAAAEAEKISSISVPSSSSSMSKSASPAVPPSAPASSSSADSAALLSASADAQSESRKVASIPTPTPVESIQMPKISSCFSLLDSANANASQRTIIESLKPPVIPMTASTVSALSASTDLTSAANNADSRLVFGNVTPPISGEKFREFYNAVIKHMNQLVSKKMHDIDMAVRRESKIIPASTDGILCVVRWSNFLDAHQAHFLFIWEVRMATTSFFAATITNMMPMVVDALGVVNIAAMEMHTLPLLGRMILQNVRSARTEHLAIVMQGRQKYWLVKGFLSADGSSACAKPTPTSHPLLTQKINLLCNMMVRQRVREFQVRKELKDRLSDIAPLTRAQQPTAEQSRPAILPPPPPPQTLLPTPSPLPPPPLPQLQAQPKPPSTQSVLRTTALAQHQLQNINNIRKRPNEVAKSAAASSTASYTGVASMVPASLATKQHVQVPRPVMMPPQPQQPQLPKLQPQVKPQSQSKAQPVGQPLPKQTMTATSAASAVQPTMANSLDLTTMQPQQPEMQPQQPQMQPQQPEMQPQQPQMQPQQPQMQPQQPQMQPLQPRMQPQQPRMQPQQPQMQPRMQPQQPRMQPQQPQMQPQQPQMQPQQPRMQPQQPRMQPQQPQMQPQQPQMQPQQPQMQPQQPQMQPRMQSRQPQMPSQEEFAHMKSNIQMRKVRTEDLPELHPPELHRHDHRWLVLDLYKDFSHIFVADFRDLVSIDRIHKVMAFARLKQKIVKLQFFQNAPLFAFVTPMSSRMIYFGPLLPNQPPPLLMLLQSVDGHLMLREVYQQQHNIVCPPNECTTGFWMLQYDGHVHFEVEKNSAESFGKSPNVSNPPRSQSDSGAPDDNDDTDDDCVIVESETQSVQPTAAALSTTPSASLQSHNRQAINAPSQLEARRSSSRTDGGVLAHNQAAVEPSRYNFTIETAAGNGNQLVITSNEREARSGNLPPLPSVPMSMQVPELSRLSGFLPLPNLPPTAVLTGVEPASADASYGSTIYIAPRRENDITQIATPPPTKKLKQQTTASGVAASSTAEAMPKMAPQHAPVRKVIITPVAEALRDATTTPLPPPQREAAKVTSKSSLEKDKVTLSQKQQVSAIANGVNAMTIDDGGDNGAQATSGRPAAKTMKWHERLRRALKRSASADLGQGTRQAGGKNCTTPPIQMMTAGEAHEQSNNVAAPVKRRRFSLRCPSDADTEVNNVPMDAVMKLWTNTSEQSAMADGTQPTQPHINTTHSTQRIVGEETSPSGTPTLKPGIQPMVLNVKLDSVEPNASILIKPTTLMGPIISAKNDSGRVVVTQLNPSSLIRRAIASNQLARTTVAPSSRVAPMQGVRVVSAKLATPLKLASATTSTVAVGAAGAADKVTLASLPAVKQDASPIAKVKVCPIALGATKNITAATSTSLNLMPVHKVMRPVRQQPGSAAIATIAKNAMETATTEASAAAVTVTTPTTTLTTTPTKTPIRAPTMTMATPMVTLLKSPNSVALATAGTNGVTVSTPSWTTCSNVITFWPRTNTSGQLPLKSGIQRIVAVSAAGMSAMPDKTPILLTNTKSALATPTTTTTATATAITTGLPKKAIIKINAPGSIAQRRNVGITAAALKLNGSKAAAAAAAPAPSATVAAPSAIVAAPSAIVAAPSATVAAPSATAASPSATAAAPSATAASPSATAAAPSATAASPSATAAAPSATAASPSATAAAAAKATRPVSEAKYGFFTSNIPKAPKYIVKRVCEDYIIKVPQVGILQIRGLPRVAEFLNDQVEKRCPSLASELPAIWNFEERQGTTAWQCNSIEWVDDEMSPQPKVVIGANQTTKTPTPVRSKTMTANLRKGTEKLSRTGKLPTVPNSPKMSQRRSLPVAAKAKSQDANKPSTSASAAVPTEPILIED